MMSTLLYALRLLLAIAMGAIVWVLTFVTVFAIGVSQEQVSFLDGLMGVESTLEYPYETFWLLGGVALAWVVGGAALWAAFPRRNQPLIASE